METFCLLSYNLTILPVLPFCYSSKYLPVVANESESHMHRKYLTSMLQNKVDTKTGYTYVTLPITISDIFRLSTPGAFLTLH